MRRQAFATGGENERVPIPRHLRLLFWDASLDELDPTAYPAYAIERVLEYGDEDDVAWLGRTFTREQIRGVVRTDRRASRGSRRISGR